MPATQERGGEVSKWPRQRLKANRDRAVGGVCVCGGGGVYLHLLVHFHIDGFDFVQLMPESDQRVLLTGERLIMSCSRPPTHVPLPSVTAHWLEFHL